MRRCLAAVTCLGLAACSTNAWTPRTATLLYSSNHEGRAGLYLRRGAEEPVRLGPESLRPNYPEWSPDGTKIVFQNRTEQGFDLWTMHADGSHTAPLVTAPGHDYLPSFTPDGAAVVYVSRPRTDDGSDEPRFRRRDLRTGDDTELALPSPGSSAALSFAPDGRTVWTTWRERPEAPAVVARSTIDGNTWQPITDGPRYDGSPCASPDGRRVAYYEQHDAGARLVVLDLETGARTVLVDNGYAWSPRWSPDGAWLLYTAQTGDDERELDLYAVRADGSATPELVGGGPGRQAEGRWHPAGR